MIDGAQVYCQVNVKLERQLSFLKSVTHIIIVMLLQNNPHDSIFLFCHCTRVASSGWWVDIHLFEQILIGRTIAVLLSKEKQHFLVHYFRGTGGTHAD